MFEKILTDNQLVPAEKLMLIFGVTANNIFSANFQPERLGSCER
jgi:hypothetical protein